MKNSIEEYEYHISYSEEDAAYIATVAEFPYLSADGSSPAAAYEAIKSVVEAAVDILRDEQKDIPLPLSKREYKGNISLRLSPETHRMAAIQARQEGCSLNQFLTSLIERNLYADSIEAVIDKLCLIINGQLKVTDNLTQRPNQQNPFWAKASHSQDFENYEVDTTVPEQRITNVSQEEA
ncbi:MAG: HicB family protein [Spirochaetes bacterium ADurb.Bin110]|nr:MAG: HicB family protein [Spirochaetes bacterium ADurb.Bin110]